MTTSICKNERPHFPTFDFANMLARSAVRCSIGRTAGRVSGLPLARQVTPGMLRALSNEAVEPARTKPTLRTLPGDWQCAQCGFHNFAKNATCKQCNAEKGDSVSLFNVRDWSCPSCNYSNFGRNTACRECGTPRPENAGPSSRKPVAKKGDWTCSKCNELNFARRTECYKCGNPSGDWICACGVRNFSWRTECFACSAAKPVVA